MSARELCDAAEVLWVARESEDEMLRLLAAVAVGLGHKAAQLQGYEPPSVRIADWLVEADKPDPALRRLQVEAFLAGAGGDG